MSITLDHQATVGCWTNLKEVREYAEEKLRIEGLKIVNAKMPFGKKHNYNLFIRVNALRAFKGGFGPCVGNITLEIWRFSYINGAVHKSVIAEVSQLLTGVQENLNKQVVALANMIISEMNSPL